jgi:hypothetical protein
MNFYGTVVRRCWQGDIVSECHFVRHKSNPGLRGEKSTIRPPEPRHGVSGSSLCRGNQLDNQSRLQWNQKMASLNRLWLLVCGILQKKSICRLLLCVFWHGYVLHEGITHKSRVPRTSQMTSRLLRNTAAAMRAHNVLCNSYNKRPLLCARITCYLTVITVEINRCSFRSVRFALLYVVTRSKIV